MPLFRGAHVQVSGVGHRYRRGGQAVAGIDLTVEPGSCVSLVGRSGSGKSTLLHIVAGLVQPTEGDVHIDGRRVAGPNPSWVVMFQQPSLLPWMTVEQNVGLGLTFLGRRAGRAEKIAELLSLVELGDLAKRNVQDLSGGQQQRVALARSLAVEPALLMLDEPFSALDTFTRTALQRDVRAIVRRLGITLLLVTHDIGEAVLMSDRAIVLAGSPGRVAADIALDDLPDERTAAGPRVPDARRRIEQAFEQATGQAPVAAPPAAAAPRLARVAPAGAPVPAAIAS